MSDCVDFGVIERIEPEKDYSIIDDYGHVYELYRCVSVPDDIVNEWILPAAGIPSFLGSLSRAFSGIDHYGVTLLPPESIGAFLAIVEHYRSDKSVAELVKLLITARKMRYYVICFGI